VSSLALTRLSPTTRRLIAVACFLVVFLALLGSWRWVDIPWSAIPADLQVYRQAGRAVLAGMPLYAAEFPTWNGGNGLPFVYTPFAAMLFVPLGLVSSSAATFSWTLVSLVALVFVLAFALVPISDGFHYGQVGLLLGAFVLCDVVLLSGSRFRFQGVLVGVATAVKLTPAIFVIFWLVDRKWRPAFTALATTASLWLVAALVLRSDTVRYFTNVLVRGDSMSTAPNSFQNQSFNGALVRAGLEGFQEKAVWLGLSLAVLAWVMPLARRLSRQDDLVAAVAVIGLGGVLISPVSWVHHAVWLLPAIAALLGTRRGSPPAGPVRWFIVTLAYVAFSYAVNPILLSDFPFANDYYVGCYLVLLALFEVASRSVSKRERTERTLSESELR
jgi:alpha-1,2-mannosyltransferase